jgi:hypothetical protein
MVGLFNMAVILRRLARSCSCRRDAGALFEQVTMPAVNSSDYVSILYHSERSPFR